MKALRPIARLAKRQIEVLNVFDETEFDPERVNDYDALFVGGASEASVVEPQKYTFLNAGIRMLLYCLNVQKPVFASCFGFQLAVIALGGKIVRDKSNFEMGTLPISLRPNAADDLLLHDTPNGFMAVSVHQEKALALPPDCMSLAYTAECEHVFRVGNKPFWAFQFHPEVDLDTLISRLTTYKNRYTGSDDHLSEVLSSAVGTPDSNILLKKFVDRVLID